jgi:carbonic anhydrase/acetyltransferase-like protein (isoleucine patch superfamily)
MRIPYLDFVPSIADPADCAPTAAIVGRTVAGPGLVMRDYATLRGDGEWVRVGSSGYFGERATVHIADAMLCATIGNDVTVGRFALVHACTVDDRVVVGDAALVMDDAHVGAGSLITAGSLVPPRKRLPGGWIYSGYPVTPLREIGAAELAEAAAAIRQRTTSALVTSSELPPLTMDAYSREIDLGAAAGAPAAARRNRTSRRMRWSRARSTSRTTRACISRAQSSRATAGSRSDRAPTCRTIRCSSPMRPAARWSSAPT